MAPCSVVCRRHEMYPIGMSSQLVAFFKRTAALICGIIHGDRKAAVFLHEGEAWNISWPIPYIYHVGKGNSTHFFRHVIVDILLQIEQSLIDSKKELGFLSVADSSPRETDMAIFFIKFASENSFDMFGDLTPFKNGFEP